MKRVLIILIAVALAVPIFANASAPEPGLGNFVYTSNYSSGQFRDVGDSDWFGQYVADAYNFGFLRGKSENVFDPGGLLTLGETVTLAARLRSIYFTGNADFAESTPYYAAYTEYALLHGIIGGHDDYGAPVTRARFAELMHNALPPEAFPAKNVISDYGINDVAPDTAAGAAVYVLYRAGILAGSDRYGTFFEGSNITRAEACAVLVRIADPNKRVNTLLPGYIPAEIIFQRRADAVFMLEMFDGNGGSIRTGSGFFISASGLAVTNLHVIENASRATLTLYNGEIYQMRGVHAVSEEFNLIIFSVEADDEGFSYLHLADSDLVEAGSTVYALGSPRGLHNTMSEGIISHPSREVDSEKLIQFTAPISFGSGGSPLLNSLGQVVGVTSSSFSYGQNLNLAVPVNHIKTLEYMPMVTLISLLEQDAGQ